MPLYKLVKNTDSQYIIVIALVIIGFFIYLYPELLLREKMAQEHFKSSLSKCYKIDQLMCSPKCISSQFPVSFNTGDDPRIKDEEIGTKYIPTNYMCTGKHGRGAVCVPKESLDMLRYRGGNSL